jgi:outer membrane usher protein
MWTCLWNRLRRVHAPGFLTLFLIIPGASATPGSHSAASATLVPVRGVQLAAPRMGPGAIDFEEWLVVVDVNRQQLNESVVVLQDPKGTLYLAVKDLRRWRLRLPETATSVDYLGETYFPLDAMSKVSHEFDPKKLRLTIDAGAEAFDETTPRERSGIETPPPVKSGHGGFFNYDLFGTHSSISTQRSGLFELGYFNRYGVGTASAIADKLGSDGRVTRLDTTWTQDYPERMESLRIGDSITRPGAWGRSVRFGGIQYGTNFGTQPGFVSFPPQGATGQAVLPSTVDVFVNNAMVAHEKVPPGPFSIANLPVVTGAGDVKLVVRDLLGREQVITQPFYASPLLLREGLTDFSYEIGAIRENYGIKSSDYGPGFGSGTYRRGMSERFTAEIRGEASQGNVAAGAGGDYLISALGTVSGYIAGSHGNSGSGTLALVGIEHLGSPWSFNARTQWMSDRFTLVGLPLQQFAPERLSSASFGYTAGSGGAISVTYVSQHTRSGADTRIATLGYSKSLGSFGSFSISASRDFVGDASTSIYAMLSIPFDASTSLSFAPQNIHRKSTGSHSDLTATLQRNLPFGEGYGYRLQARSDGYREASYTQQTEIGTYTVDAARMDDATTTRLAISGGLAFLGGGAFLSRRIDQSFAVVRVPDFPNVRVLVDNQPAGKTDAKGNALIPRLRAYDKNVISVDQRDIPINAEIGALKVVAVPYFRSGVEVEFPIRLSRGATLTIHLEDGKPLPVGASVQIVGQPLSHAVGLDGQTYLISLRSDNRVRATWDGRSCEFDLPFTPSRDDPLPDLGTFVCKGATP